MLNGLLRKKKKTDESANTQVSRDEVGARLKGFFKDDSAGKSDQPSDNRSALKRLVASAASEALGDPKHEVSTDSDDVARVEEAEGAVHAVSQAISASRGTNPIRPGSASAKGPTFRDIGRDIQGHLETLRRSNADIQAFLNGQARPEQTPVTKRLDEPEDAGSAMADEAAVVEDEVLVKSSGDEAVSASTDVESPEAAVTEYDASILQSENEPADTAHFAQMAENEQIEVQADSPAGHGVDEPVASEDAGATTDEVKAPSMVPDVEDIVEEADEMLGEEADDDFATDEARDADQKSEAEPHHAYSEKVSLGDQIATMTPDEHQERLRRLEEMVTGGFENQGEQDDEAPRQKSEDHGEPITQEEATTLEPLQTVEPGEIQSTDAVDEGTQNASETLSIPLMLSDEVMEQEDDTAAHELNAQICDFLLFDAYVTSEELSQPAFMGWSVDFFWRNAAEGGLARFAHLAMDRPEIWEALVRGLEAIEAESHLRLVEALQALLAQDSDLAEALSADPAAGSDVEVLQQLDEALAEADEEFSLPHAVGGWLKSQDGVEVLETETLRRKVSAYAEMPQLQARDAADETA
ncbi:hypothetical protein [Notoacmeibacter sp. MSK16QG-6]|uniref:DMP19 family protein n=1 Tax=Notoacmeibacter sp. MSK16QG-6 TaxID=2957982 RepID=UPI0020A02C63|nr:hypothetical protein [Notoacmeibacter sp. MSK16QG-6]MCP1199645.1 hypothetical protein [Notoacmeibacter sp. MSK16QG-6]